MTRAMKDSGVEWIGEIPKYWGLSPLFTLFAERKNKNLNGDETNLLSLSYGKIIRKSINTVDGLLPESFNTYNIIEPGDIVFRLTDLQNDKRSLRTGLVKEHGIITSAYVTIKSITEICNTYYHYLLHSYDVCKVFYNMGNGVRQGLNFNELKKMILLVPPLSEQQAIADYLDDKCAEIDNLKAEITEQIEVLKKYKKSVITEAVTKGLDPNVPMKDSGVEWIGDIPTDWKIVRNKYLMNKIKNIKAVYNNELILSLTMNGVIVRDLDNPTGKMPTNFDGYQIVEPNNLLMCLFDIDVTPRCVGIIKNYGLCSPAYSQFKLNNNINVNYAYYYYLNLDFSKELLHLAKNLRHSLTEEQLGYVPVPVPPLSEQQAIADYLDDKCAEIDSVIKNKEEQLAALDDYKKSLIYEYVTGKKQVPQLKEA